MDNKFFSDFKRPPSKYRAKPFWAWNSSLNPAELRRQISIFKEMGFGGFFMHSRTGLETEYLGDQWFDCVRASVTHAEKLGMEAWLYDEDRWPSGFAGGLVTKKPDYRLRYLAVECSDSADNFKWTSDIVAVFTAMTDGFNASDVKQVHEKHGISCKKGHSVIAFRMKQADPHPRYNGCTYLDTMNEDAVDEFIRVTHKAYAEHFGQYFGSTVPGIFTDEPNYGGIGPRRLPWTGRLQDIFRRRYGYDLIPRLMELVFDVEGMRVSRPRFHYHDCITHLFVNAFSKRIGVWCGENNLLHTGHVLGEHSLSVQVNHVGSAMRFYEHMQVPGIDILTEHRRGLSIAKQCTSVANQLGRAVRLSETDGCTGWDLSFESHKAIGDWQAACGINLRCPHLSWYTMLGQCKRDYPASISYQSPWWEYYDRVEGYFARVNAAMSRGREVRDLLVIHPVESLWADRCSSRKDVPEYGDYDAMLHRLATVLLSGHIDFDYGDEELISRLCSIETSETGAVFQVGEASYRSVLVPPLKTIRSSTLRLLRQFRDSGGEVVFVGDPPEYVDARASGEASELAGRCACCESVNTDMVELVEKNCRRLSITGPEGKELPEVIYLLREDSEAFYLFVANTSYIPKNFDDADVKTENRLVSHPEVLISGFEGCSASPVELDPQTGEIYACRASESEPGWLIKTDLPRIGSRIFVAGKDSAVCPDAAPRAGQKKLGSKKLDPGKWEYTLSEDNCLVLDRPAVRIGGGDWTSPEYVLRVDRKVRRELGIEPRGKHMVQPWAQEKNAESAGISVELSYSFKADFIPGGGLYLGIEQPDVYNICLNGNSVKSEAASGWWVDKSLRRVPIDPALLRYGENELRLSLDYKCGFSGLETVYLLGSFATAVDGTSVSMTEPEERLALGDWCLQGLDFFSGSVCYRHRIRPELKKEESLFIRVSDFKGVAVRVIVDGKSAGIIAWEPYELDITGMIDAGARQVELGIEVIGHRRNSHGPHHLTVKRPGWTGAEEFEAEADRWYDGYNLVPAGLFSCPELEVRDSG